MAPPPLHLHSKRESGGTAMPAMKNKTTNTTTHLKINKESHCISKNQNQNHKQQQQRQPVIIYTHSPRVIETNPRDFMQLVQKLTGLPRDKRKQEEEQPVVVEEELEDETTSSSSPPLLTEEYINSCVAPPPPPPPPLMEPMTMMPSYFNTLLPPPLFGPDSPEFLLSSNSNCTSSNNKAPFNFNYADPFFF
ncbi:VQ motif-containing protein 20-like [Arachis ipaensis]|uniref:VQ motif-containing protein 20-like n=1 Tax=Arachis ipaensis TaxID=130454 RepID=UPI0007AF2B95|nr:VQ motif-containing protein 20-like [Arachis ipaensis]